MLQVSALLAAMDETNLTLGVVVGATACFAYRGLLVLRYLEENSHWPWDQPGKMIRGRVFLAALAFRVAVAGGLTWLFVETGQVNGLFGAAVIGIASEEIVINMFNSGRKELKDE